MDVDDQQADPQGFASSGDESVEFEDPFDVGFLGGGGLPEDNPASEDGRSSSGEYHEQERVQEYVQQAEEGKDRDLFEEDDVLEEEKEEDRDAAYKVETLPTSAKRPYDISLSSSSSDSSVEIESPQSSASYSEDDLPSRSGAQASFRAPGPASFRAPNRFARARTVGPAGTLLSSPLKPKPTTLVEVASRHHLDPLPEVPVPFNILNHAPFRSPGPAAEWTHPAGTTVEERIVLAERDKARQKSVEDQKKLREANADAWAWGWQLDAAVGGSFDRKGKGKAVEGDRGDLHDAQFFPFAAHNGLEFMKGVFAVCGGDEVRLFLPVPIPEKTIDRLSSSS
jgi:hypothetical protein